MLGLRPRKEGGKKNRQMFCKSLKAHVEKMPDPCLSTMFLKTKELTSPLHDVDENKGESRSEW